MYNTESLKIVGELIDKNKARMARIDYFLANLREAQASTKRHRAADVAYYEYQLEQEKNDGIWAE